MPTFRKDLHLGHEVPLVEADDILNGSITHEKLADDSVDTNNIKDRAITEPKLADGAVSTRTIQNGAVTKEKIAKGAVEEIMKPITDDLQNQIDSFNEHGLSVSNHFGSDPHIGISQKTLTEAFNNVWNKLEEITGEVLRGISMTITPSYFVGEDGCDVHITAEPVDAGKFESIKFWKRAEGAAQWEIIYNSDDHEDPMDYEYGMATDTEIDITTSIMCVAKILGQEYTETGIITHYPSVWVGAGNSYQSVMVDANLVQLRQHMRGEVDVTASTGNRIYIIIAESLADGFIRADMNGIEISFTQSIVTIDGKNYKVFASEDTYQAATYNIDING